MKAILHKEKLKLSETLFVLLNELNEECVNTIKLIGNIRINGLTDKQIEDILGELSAAVTHLRVHSEEVEKVIEEELDMEQADRVGAYYNKRQHGCLDPKIQI